MLASHQIYTAWANPAGTCGEPEPRLMTHRVTSSCVVSSVRVYVIVTWLAAAVWQELWWGRSQVALNLFCRRKTTAAKSQGVSLTINRKSCVFLALACLVWVQPQGSHAVNSSEPPQCIGVALMWSTWVAQKHFLSAIFLPSSTVPAPLWIYLRYHSVLCSKHWPPASLRAAIWVIIIFCVASSVGLHSCLWPFVKRLPFCKCRWDTSAQYHHPATVDTSIVSVPGTAGYSPV